MQQLGKKLFLLQCEDLSENNNFDLLKKHLMIEIGVTVSRFFAHAGTILTGYQNYLETAKADLYLN